LDINIIDIGFGNIRSVKSWLERNELPTRVITNSRDLSSELVILPGVGSAGPYMHKLDQLGFSDAIKNHLEKGRRLFGICLGYQILFQHSEEDNGTNCLAVLDGKVKRLKQSRNHNGWERIQLDIGHFREKGYWGSKIDNRRKSLNGRVFYNHEYGVITDQIADVNLNISSALCQYTGLIMSDNIAGVQFHPEKSQLFGRELLQVLL
jgi:imidazole glycerol-phosphate synthase subunit HisH